MKPFTRAILLTLLSLCLHGCAVQRPDVISLPSALLGESESSVRSAYPRMEFDQESANNLVGRLDTVFFGRRSELGVSIGSSHTVEEVHWQFDTSGSTYYAALDSIVQLLGEPVVFEEEVAVWRDVATPVYIFTRSGSRYRLSLLSFVRYLYSSYYGLTNRSSYTAPTSTSSGDVHVRGYRRKDGTYVKPHTRSKPRRK